MVEEKQYLIKISYKAAVEIFADSEAEALEKAKKQIGLTDSKFKDTTYNIHVTPGFGPRHEEKNAKLPFPKFGNKVEVNGENKDMKTKKCGGKKK